VRWELEQSHTCLAVGTKKRKLPLAGALGRPDHEPAWEHILKKLHPVKARLNQHYGKKDFWDWAVFLVAKYESAHPCHDRGANDNPWTGAKRFRFTSGRVGLPG
jgi:hypothetical protein